MAPIKVPFTTTVTSTGLLIQTAGEPIGAITSWSTKQDKGATEVFEFGSGVTKTVGGGDDIQADPGEAYEIVPGNITGTTISAKRYDIYSNRFENAFGTQNLQMLTRQDRSIRLIEFWSSPDGTLDFHNIYFGCWFTSLGRNMDAKGDRIVMADATVKYTRRREYTG